MIHGWRVFVTPVRASYADPRLSTFPDMTFFVAYRLLRCATVGAELGPDHLEKTSDTSYAEAILQHFTNEPDVEDD